MKDREKDTFRIEGNAGRISFDFSATDTLKMSHFFHDLASSLEEASKTDISFLVMEITGFQNENDLKNLESGDIKHAFERAEKSCLLLLGMRIPLIGVIRGFICGPILELILFLDFPIVSRKTKLSSLMLDRGYMPHMGMITNLSELIGKQGLYHFIFNGMDFTAETATTRSIVYKVVEDHKLDAECASLVQSLSEKESYPVRVIKELSRYNRNLYPESADLLERYNFALCFSEPNFRDKIDQFFKHKK